METWYLKLEDPVTAELVTRAVDMLASSGPALRRPLVGEIVARRHKNMKELRPGSAGGSEIRILFAFDPVRRAILLLAGDKSGQWERWYRQAIPLADQRFDEHLAELDEEADR